MNEYLPVRLPRTFDKLKHVVKVARDVLGIVIVEAKTIVAKIHRKIVWRALSGTVDHMGDAES